MTGRSMKHALLVRFNLAIPECTLGDASRKQYRIFVGNVDDAMGNIGTIRRVRGWVDRVARLSPEGKPDFSSLYVEKVPLTWALRFGILDVDLQFGQWLPLNFVVMGLPGLGGTVPTAEFVTVPDACSAPSPFTKPGDYDCVVAITSDDTPPVYVQFMYHWGGDVADSGLGAVSFFEQRPAL